VTATDEDTNAGLLDGEDAAPSGARNDRHTPAPPATNAGGVVKGTWYGLRRCRFRRLGLKQQPTRRHFLATARTQLPVGHRRRIDGAC